MRTSMIVGSFNLNYVFLIIRDKHRRALSPAVHDAIPGLVAFFRSFTLNSVHISREQKKICAAHASYVSRCKQFCHIYNNTNNIILLKLFYLYYTMYYEYKKGYNPLQCRNLNQSTMSQYFFSLQLPQKSLRDRRISVQAPQRRQSTEEVSSSFATIH